MPPNLPPVTVGCQRTISALPGLRRGTLERENQETCELAWTLLDATLAEGVRFELTVPLPARRISSPVH